MKIKCVPEDFRVEEVAECEPSGGSFALYRLTKRGLGTPEAVEAIARRWNLPRRAIRYGGLKDRHALTDQFLTIRNGPRRNVSQKNLQLVYLGQVSRPVQSSDVVGNRFSIVVRDVKAEQTAELDRRLQQIAEAGLPNYFDDQRFGSVGESGEFVAAAWCRGDYERALWLALADPNSHDRSRERQQKQILRQHWGDWAQCKSLLARSHRRSIVSYLADKPTDFRGALARLRLDLRGLYLSAFQSYVWNRLLAHVLDERLRPEQIVFVPMRLGRFPFPIRLEEPLRNRLASLELPLPSARVRHEVGEWGPVLGKILKDEGLTLRQMRVKYPRDSFFSKGHRPAWFKPEGLTWSWCADDLYAGCRKLQLQFQLPRGCYATLLIKRLFAQ